MVVLVAAAAVTQLSDGQGDPFGASARELAKKIFINLID
jgi:hypothetical protein